MENGSARAAPQMLTWLRAMPGWRASSDSAPKEGGSLIIGITSGDPLAVNPLYASDRTTLTMMQALYDALYSYYLG